MLRLRYKRPKSLALRWGACYDAHALMREGAFCEPIFAKYAFCERGGRSGSRTEGLAGTKVFVFLHKPGNVHNAAGEGMTGAQRPNSRQSPTKWVCREEGATGERAKFSAQRETEQSEPGSDAGMAVCRMAKDIRSCKRSYINHSRRDGKIFKEEFHT